MVIGIAFLKFALCWLVNVDSSNGNALCSNCPKVDLKLLGVLG